MNEQTTEDRWDMRRVAEYLGLTAKYVREAVATKPSFPKPVIQTSRRNRFWRPEDVKAWAASPH